MPVSRTSICAHSPSTRAETWTEPPAFVNLIAFVSRFRTTCVSLSSSAETAEIVVALERQRDTPATGALTDHCEPVFEHVRQ